MMPNKEYEFLYRKSLQEAKHVFKDYFTCKLDIMPHVKDVEIAVIPLNNTPSDKYDNIQVTMLQMPALFITATLRKGDKKIISISTRSGNVTELWKMVEPIIMAIANGVYSYDVSTYSRFKNIGRLVAAGDIGFNTYDENGVMLPREV